MMWEGRPLSARNVLLDGLALRIGELEALRAPERRELIYSPTGLGGGSCAARSISGGYSGNRNAPSVGVTKRKERRA